MPKEKFYSATGQEPMLAIAWHGEQPAVEVNGVEFDRSAVNRLIRVLRKARNQTFGEDR